MAERAAKPPAPRKRPPRPPRPPGAPTKPERARKAALQRRNLAEAALDLPASGPSSRGLRVRLLKRVIEKIRINHGGRGVRSAQWKVLPEDLILQAAHAVVVDARPAHAVAEKMHPGETAAARRERKRMTELLGRIKSAYVREYERHEAAAGMAEKIDQFAADPAGAMRGISLKLAARVDTALDAEQWEATGTQERHLLLRALNTVILASETHAKVEKIDAEAERIRRDVRKACEDLKAGKVDASELGALLDRIASGENPEEAVGAARKGAA